MVHEKQIEIRWRDLDVFGHVNHVVFLTYLEEARDEWLSRVHDDPDAIMKYVLVRAAIDYRRELTLADDRIVARCSLAGLGRSSVTTREEILKANGELAAEAGTVLVARDTKSGRARPLTEKERIAFERAANESK